MTLTPHDCKKLMQMTPDEILKEVKTHAEGRIIKIKNDNYHQVLRLVRIITSATDQLPISERPIILSPYISADKPDERLLRAELKDSLIYKGVATWIGDEPRVILCYTWAARIREPLVNVKRKLLEEIIKSGEHIEAEKMFNEGSKHDVKTEAVTLIENSCGDALERRPWGTVCLPSLREYFKEHADIQNYQHVVLSSDNNVTLVGFDIYRLVEVLLKKQGWFPITCDINKNSPVRAKLTGELEEITGVQFGCSFMDEGGEPLAVIIEGTPKLELLKEANLLEPLIEELEILKERISELFCGVSYKLTLF